MSLAVVRWEVLDEVALVLLHVQAVWEFGTTEVAWEVVSQTGAVGSAVLDAQVSSSLWDSSKHESSLSCV